MPLLELGVKRGSRVANRLHTIPAQQPEWFRRMPADACLTSKEVAEVTGYAWNSVLSMAAKGYLPMPQNIKREVMNAHAGRALSYHTRWSVGEIRKWLAEQKAVRA